jgi:hypothetical protein
MSGLMTGIRKPTNPLIGLAAVLLYKSGSLILVGWLNNPGRDLVVFHGYLFLDCYSSVFYASGPGINGCSLATLSSSPIDANISVTHYLGKIRDNLKPGVTHRMDAGDSHHGEHRVH